MPFPTSPTVNSTYTTSLGYTYQWTSDKVWRLISGPGGPGVVLPPNERGVLSNNGSGSLSWSGANLTLSGVHVNLSPPSPSVGVDDDIIIRGQTTDGSTARVYTKVDGDWVQSAVVSPNGGSVFTNLSTTMNEPSSSLGVDGDMAMSYNSPRTRYRMYIKNDGDWAPVSMGNEDGGTIISLTDNSLAAPDGAIGFDGDTAIITSNSGASMKVFTKRAGDWVASSTLASTGGTTYQITDNSPSPPANSFGDDGDGAIITNNAGTSGGVYVKRSGVWKAVTNLGLAPAVTLDDDPGTTGWIFPNGISSLAWGDGSAALYIAEDDINTDVEFEVTTNGGTTWTSIATATIVRDSGAGAHGAFVNVYFPASKAAATSATISCLLSNGAARRYSKTIPAIAANVNGIRVRIMTPANIVLRGAHGTE